MRSIYETSFSNRFWETIHPNEPSACQYRTRALTTSPTLGSSACERRLRGLHFCYETSIIFEAVDMSDVWSYLSGSRRRARSKASLDPQSSCCISDTTAPGSPSQGLDLSGKYGSLAATSDGRGGASLLDGARSVSLDHAELLSPATASSLAASSALFSPSTARTELPPASLRTSASLRDSYASTSWVASSSHGLPEEGDGDMSSMPADVLPQQPAVAGPAADYAASQANSVEQHEPGKDTPLQRDPVTNDVQPAVSQGASPLSEWGNYKTPSGSRQPTQDHGVGGESPQRVANLDAWPAGLLPPDVRRSSSQVARSSTRHQRTSSNLQPENADVGSTAAARQASSTAAYAATSPIANAQRRSLASLRSALRSRRGPVHSTSISSTGHAAAHSAADGSADGKAGPLQSFRQSAAAERSSISGELQHRMHASHIKALLTMAYTINIVCTSHL